MLRIDVCLYRSQLGQPAHPGGNRRAGGAAVLLPQAGRARGRCVPTQPRAGRSDRRDAALLGRPIVLASPRKTRQVPDRDVSRGPASARVETSAARDPGSFRDPTGFVYRRDGILYRQINASHATGWELFRSTGLYNRVVANGWLVEQTDVDASFAFD